MTYDVAVVGGGVVGCAVACELAGHGASVILLERERVGSGASSAAAGMLAPQSEAHPPEEWQQLLLAARAEHEPLAARLREETGVDVGYRRDGVLRIACTEAERRELQERAASQRADGLAAEWLEPEDAVRLEPALSPEIAGALWLPEESQVHSPRLVQALALLATRLGVDVREGAPVLGVASQAVIIPNERLSAGVVVLAGGVWTAAIEGVSLPLQPVKGQIVSAAATAAAPRHMIWGPGAYLTPKADGQLLIGATEEPGNFDTRPTLSALSGLIARGAQLVPSLAGLPLNTAWAGLRPALPDRLPAIGRLADALFAATGHFRNGILLGPLTGKLIARLVLGEDPGVDLRLYSPDRFAREPALA